MKFKFVMQGKDGEIEETTCINVPAYIEAEALEMVDEPHSGGLLPCLAELLLQKYASTFEGCTIVLYAGGREVYRATEP